MTAKQAIEADSLERICNSLQEHMLSPSASVQALMH